MESLILPPLPAPLEDFVSYFESQKAKGVPVPEILQPYLRYESRLREVYAQDALNPELKSNAFLNTTPLFALDSSAEDKELHPLKIQARDLASETEEEKGRYLLPLTDDKRLAHGSPAVVSSVAQFRRNFNLFSESSLVDLDWSNVVVGGSAVTTALLNVPGGWGETKRSQREYYHEKLAPASDVDLFIYGLTEEEALEKILHIEGKIRDSILYETTTIRTKNAITIVSQYPTRHVQIVLRLYKSMSEILTGFDVDCSCACYDGTNVYATPRAIAAFSTQTNRIDLERRSPSYENRLSKYSRRGFEAHWPLFERSKIDPTVYERTFGRTMGLARLLLLEAFPTPTERENYVDQRRRERGRPARPLGHRTDQFTSNLKERLPDEVADWMFEDDVSSYNTFQVPYGPKYTAKKVERILFKTDLLLNAEWNKPGDREVHLHRHPAFFGHAEQVFQDCCGFCPEPITDEEHDVAEKEAKIYISGPIKFMKDDPGRQAIGSFNPITDGDWTEMAYIGNTEMLCEAIVENDVEFVKEWCAREGAEVNRRDYTGRSPLHLACISGSEEIVQCLVDAGARITSRVVDGMTALHIAARRGNAAIVKILLLKSEGNEAEEDRKQQERRAARTAEKRAAQAASAADTHAKDEEDVADEDDDTDASFVDDDDDSVKASQPATDASYIKVLKAGDSSSEMPDDIDNESPDIFDINITAWDEPVSPLHLAVFEGHVEVIKVMVQQFGADVLRPINFEERGYDSRKPKLILMVGMHLPLEKFINVTRALLEVGAVTAQADSTHATALYHGLSQLEPDSFLAFLDLLLEFDRPATESIINTIVLSSDDRWTGSFSTALTNAFHHQNLAVVERLIELGANIFVDPEEADAAMKQHFASRDIWHRSPDNLFGEKFSQPLIAAVDSDRPRAAQLLLKKGADPNTLATGAVSALRMIKKGGTSYGWQQNLGTALDRVQIRMKLLAQNIEQMKERMEKNLAALPEKPEETPHEAFWVDIEPETYGSWVAEINEAQYKRVYKQKLTAWNQALENKAFALCKEDEERLQELESAKAAFEELLEDLLSRGAKTLLELHPPSNDTEKKMLTFDDKRNHRPHYGYTSPTLDMDKTKMTPFERYREKMSWPGIQSEGKMLFDAAWEGDLNAIKSLTLRTNERPCDVGMQDSNQFSIFHIALYRDHFDVARAILDISRIQNAPNKDNQAKVLYKLRHPDDNDSDLGYDEQEADDHDIYITSEIVDDKNTIDNLAEVSKLLKVATRPETIINRASQVWRFLPDSAPIAHQKLGVSTCDLSHAAFTEGGMNFSLYRWALYKRDASLLDFLFRMWREYAGGKTSANIDFGAELQYAMSIGYLEGCATIIKNTGLKLPIDTFVRKTKVEVKEKHEYYQGLTVHGRKRKDWADAGRGAYSPGTTSFGSVILDAVKSGNMDAAAWFLDGKALKPYLEFVQSSKDDERLQALAAMKHGLSSTISKWLNSAKYLSLHVAVLRLLSASRQDRAASLRYVEWIAGRMPDLINSSDQLGRTPLHLAFATWDAPLIEFLLSRDADQTARDSRGRNILHFLLQHISIDDKRTQQTIDSLKQLLALVDTRLLPDLFLDRCTRGLTPFAFLQSDNRTKNMSECVLKALLAASNGRELHHANTLGDLPIHSAAKNLRQNYLNTILAFDSSLLHVENSVGMTPLEIIVGKYLHETLRNSSNQSQRRPHSDESRDPLSEVKSLPDPSDVSKARSLVHKFVGDEMQKRKLVSLYEAREVARRLNKDELALESKKDEDSFEETNLLVKYLARSNYISVDLDDCYRFGRSGVTYGYRRSRWTS